MLSVAARSNLSIWLVLKMVPHVVPNQYNSARDRTNTKPNNDYVFFLCWLRKIFVYSKWKKNHFHSLFSGLAKYSKGCLCDAAPPPPHPYLFRLYHSPLRACHKVLNTSFFLLYHKNRGFALIWAEYDFYFWACAHLSTIQNILRRECTVGHP